MKKLYYSIGEVSDITSVEAHVLRYWETVFKDLHPKKNKAGNRVYKEEDIEVVLKLKELIQDKKYSTEGARQVLEGDGEEQDKEIPISLKKDLKEIRLFLSKLADKL
ncbi:MerR family transcriptional regulator [Balneolaceae bacterium YR4-1]|uniref:MerR family transcriptional regulator n=1 Tax=Halalkalibaculum roseum TaxID=2709311 RepID=A0A6M1SV01_9BACT|nr:MerR family transcriptional regulator [Halalkalibaculum roseum]NGP75958.1 MerR family transcriptional regulator [Halalkalibaculum roseum]